MKTAKEKLEERLKKLKDEKQQTELAILEELEKKNNLKIPKPKSKQKYFYIVPLGNLFIVFGVLGMLFFMKARLLIWIIYFVFAIPIFFISLIFLFGKLYIDRRKIKGAIIRNIPQTSYLIAEFFKENGRKEKVTVLLNTDGRTFTFEKGLYTVDKKAVWYDENKHPHSHYLYNLPNPLMFGFEKGIQEFIKQIRKEIQENNIDNIGEDKLLIDISYSSDSLQMLKKDKLLEEMHKNPESDKYIMILFGVVGFLILALVISFFVGG